MLRSARTAALAVSFLTAACVRTGFEPPGDADVVGGDTDIFIGGGAGGTGGSAGLGGTGGTAGSAGLGGTGGTAGSGGGAGLGGAGGTAGSGGGAGLGGAGGTAGSGGGAGLGGAGGTAGSGGGAGLGGAGGTAGSGGGAGLGGAGGALATQLEVLGPSLVRGGVCAGPYVIARQDGAGVPAFDANPLVVDVAVSGAAVVHGDAACGGPTATALIGAAASDTQVWVQGTVSEVDTLSASAAPLTGDTLDITLDTAPAVGALSCETPWAPTPYDGRRCVFAALGDDGGVAGLTIPLSPLTTCAFATAAARLGSEARVSGTVPASPGAPCDLVLDIDDGLGPVTASTTLTPLAYHGVVRVRALGDAPTAPPSTPNVRRVDVTWRAPTGASPSTLMVLIRGLRGVPIDTTTTAACSTGPECAVCGRTGVGPQTCVDLDVDPAPAQYDYLVVPAFLGAGQSLAGFDDTPLRITVPMPPDNMALVHRESVNFDMCERMSRQPDPLNHMRCAYDGLGAVPTNSGPGQPALGLDANYYDFGYHLFVDCWEVACNWDTFGTLAPSGGAVGDVYYRTGGNGTAACWVNTSTGWRAVNSITTAADSALAATTTPSTTSHRPPLIEIDQQTAWDVCAATSAPSYGAKRLLRRREWMAAAAAPWHAEDPGVLSALLLTALENGNEHTVDFECNANSAMGIASQAFNSANYEKSGAATGPHSFVIGSGATRNCVTRYGIQDMWGNVTEWNSDQLSGCDTGLSCDGAPSPFDDGNDDWVGFSFDGVQGPGGASMGTWTLDTGANGATRFSIPLGLPFVGTDNGNAVQLGAQLPAAELHNDVIELSTGTPAVRGTRSGAAFVDGQWSGRYTLLLSTAPTFTGWYLGARCGIGVE